MKLHTLSDIVLDILKFEGVKVSLDLRLSASKFVSLYSEYYKTPLKGNVKVNDVVERVRQFISDVRTHLPSPDQLPTEDNTKALFLYGNIIDERRSVYLGGFNTRDELEDFVSEETFKGYDWLLIVDVKEEVIIPLLEEERVAEKFPNLNLTNLH